MYKALEITMACLFSRFLFFCSSRYDTAKQVTTLSLSLWFIMMKLNGLMVSNPRNWESWLLIEAASCNLGAWWMIKHLSVTVFPAKGGEVVQHNIKQDHKLPCRTEHLKESHNLTKPHKSILHFLPSRYNFNLTMNLLCICQVKGWIEIENRKHY